MKAICQTCGNRVYTAKGNIVPHTSAGDKLPSGHANPANPKRMRSRHLARIARQATRTHDRCKGA